MTNRRPVRVPLPLRPDELVDLLLQQLAEHTEPDLDRQREQPLLRSPDQLPQSLLHTLREHGLILDRISDRYVALHGGSSFDLCRITRHAPTESGRAGGTAVTQSSTSPGTTSATVRVLAGGPRQGALSKRISRAERVARLHNLSADVLIANVTAPVR